MNKTLIDRQLLPSINTAFQYLPIITLTGPRQSGKTTLCRNLFASLPYANLEDASILQEIQTDPKGFLTKYPQGLILDEAQNYPEIFSHLQVIVDEDRYQGNTNHKYIVSGSNNFSLLEKTAQSMAGRTAVMTLLPLSTAEILNYEDDANTNKLILYGGYPAIWKTDIRGREILLSNYYTTYIERDVRKLINVKDLKAFQTFIRLCAGRVGQEFNASSLSIETGVSVPTIQHWMSILIASYVVYLLHPFHSNIGKRLTKTPKLYFYDTGLAAYLLGINTIEHIETHPLRGNLFENMVINDMMKAGSNLGKEERLFFYRDKSQHEVDVIRTTPDKTEAYEIKAGKSFSTSYFTNLNYIKGLLHDKLSKTMVVYDGEQENMQYENGIINFRHLKFY
ncbi:MAG: ATP-binding protein [Prevotella sp.]|nr:ATP-binding protein [Prevotella sp.]